MVDPKGIAPFGHKPGSLCSLCRTLTHDILRCLPLPQAGPPEFHHTLQTLQLDFKTRFGGKISGMTDSIANKKTVRTRIAPSPTGLMHIGTAYMALFNYAFAKKQGGNFIVRIEDTDRQRFVEGAEQVIFDGLKWLGIPHTEGADLGGPHAPYRQSENLPLYKKYAEELIEKGHAYYCFCSAEELDEMRKAQQGRKELPHYDRRCRLISVEDAKKRVVVGEKHVIRMKIPDHEVISWEDAIRGHVEINSDVVDDQVLMKSDGFPTYHLGVIVDDHRMEITHVMRGEEWISSTPKHILLYRFFGWEQPVFAHLPLLRNPDKSKMSKRKNDVSVPSYREKGYLPEALRNYLCLMGWSHPQEKDVFDLDEFVREMSLERIQTTGPIFDINKLNWMNGKYIREVLSEDELIAALNPFMPADLSAEMLKKVLPLVKDRLVTLKDIESLTEFFYRDIVVEKEMLIGKKSSMDEAKKFLEAAIAEFSKVEDWSAKSMETAFLALVDGNGWNRGAFFMTVRVVVTGRTATPPLFETVEVLGKDVTLKRLQAAQSVLG
jgi:glutamyl-tRNA synthetase